VYHQSQIRDPGLVNIIKLEYTLYLDLDNLVKKFILQYLKKYKMAKIYRKLTGYGGEGGREWDDDVYEGVRKVYVGQDINRITYVKFEYVKEDGQVVTTEYGKIIQQPKEVLHFIYPLITFQIFYIKYLKLTLQHYNKLLYYKLRSIISSFREF